MRRLRFRRMPRLAALGLVCLSGAPAVAQEPAAAQEPVALGLVVPTEGPRAEIGRAVRAAVEREIRSANEAGGFRGRPFELRVVEEKGLWGQGLSRVVSLSFDRPVWGVIGGLDGRGAHLIEQVITKARVPFVTPWASDFTLSRARVPWFFQAVPDDRQQAAALAGHVRAAGAGGNVLIVVDSAYDSRQLAAAVRRALTGEGARVRSMPVGDVVGGATDATAVVLAVEAAAVAPVLQSLAGRPTPPPVYAPLRLAVAPVLRAAADYPAPLLVPTLRPAGQPGAAASSVAAGLAADAVQALIAAIRTGGLDRWRIRDALAADTFETSTGRLSFEDTGRRSVRLRMVPVEQLLGGPDPGR